MSAAREHSVNLRFEVRSSRPDDLERVLTLLEDAALPVRGVAESFEAFVVAESAGQLIGAAGLELYPSGALLRSVVVQPGWKGHGVGAALVEQALSNAEARSRPHVYLLTTTAERYFPRHGFARITRADVPADVKASIEFTELCSETAIVMFRDAKSPSQSAF